MTTVELLPAVPNYEHRCHPPYELMEDTVRFQWVEGAPCRCTRCGQHWEGAGRYWFRVTERYARKAIKQRQRAARKAAKPSDIREQA